MANSHFKFKQFTIQQDRCAMKVTTDGCLFGAWVSDLIKNEKLIADNCLDIGTGTGLLSLMLMQKNTLPAIDAIEIDADAATQAGENVAASSWADRIKVHHADVKEFKNQVAYDLIISNPPFYENELKSGKSTKDIAHHSNELLLKDLLSIIKNKLSTDGFFCLLLPYKRNAEAKLLFAEQGLAITQISFVRQSTNHDFFRIMLMGKIAADEITETIINEIVIKDDNQQYTPAFIDLLKEYYLYL
jgi:tRNA1Val (adenine37-N6)-methyltransferase